MIEKIYNKYIELKKIKKLLNSLDYEDKLNGSRVVFFTIRSYSLVLHQEFFLAYQLAELGANVDIVLDDGIFEHWDYVQEHDNTDKYTLYQSTFIERFTKKTFAKLIFNVYKHKNINIVWSSRILQNIEMESVDSLTQLEKQQAESSVRRYFETGTMDISQKKQKDYYDKSLRNCAISKTLAREIILQRKPDLFITSHGIYSVWGPAFNYMKSNNINSLVYGAHAYKAQEIIISDTIAQTLSLDSDWKKFDKEHILTKDEEKKVTDYFDKRIGFKASDTKIYYGDIENFEEISIQKTDGVKTFALFPNIIWDGDIYERNTIFDGVVDWIVKTVEIFKRSPHNLVIRFHPAEATLWKDSKSLEKILRENIEDIEKHPNIYLISADKKINTYTFINQNVDVGLIYDGVLAMEMPYLRIPVISCALSRYTGAGFVYEPNNLKEYKDYIVNPDRIINDFNKNYLVKRKLLLKYAYWYFYKSGYFLPIFDKEKILTINYKPMEKKDIDINENLALQRTINKLVEYLK